MKRKRSDMDYLNLKRRCELERKIIDLVYADNKASCHFDYRITPTDEVYLALITCNPSHQEIFTLYTTEPHNNEVQCLDEIWLYLSQLKSSKNDLLTYGIVWRRMGESDSHTSNFYAKNLQEVTKKFYENKNPNDFLITSIHLIPAS